MAQPLACRFMSRLSWRMNNPGRTMLVIIQVNLKCHAERSEASLRLKTETPRSAQGDKRNASSKNEKQDSGIGRKNRYDLR